MSPLLRLWCTIGLGCGLIAGCGDEITKLTQIVVVVDSDLHVPDELDGLRIEVTGTLQEPVLQTALDSPDGLPRSLGLVHRAGPLGPMRVRAVGTLDGGTVVERVAEVYFRLGRTLKLELPLSRVCQTSRVSCDGDQTCHEGECVPAAVSDLPVFDGDAGSFILPGDVSDLDAGPGSDAGPDAEVGGASGGGAVGQSGQGGSAGQPSAAPACTIAQPADADSFFAGDAITFDGGCIEASGGASPFVRWRSSLDGTLGTQPTLQLNDLSVGGHEISLCALALSSGSPRACAAVQIKVQALPAVQASIVSLVQGSNTGDSIYGAEAELVATGEGEGLAPLTFRWLDSLQGELAGGSMARYLAPVPAGRHTLRLTVSDARGRQAMTERSFEVLPAGYAGLFEPYKTLNDIVALYDTPTAVASDGSVHYLGTQMGVVFRVSAAAAPQTAAPDAPTNTGSAQAIQDIFAHAASGQVYLAAKGGALACQNAMDGALDCQSLMLSSSVPTDIRCMRRVSAAGSDVLVVGTSGGLYVAGEGDLQNGNLHATDAAFNALSESEGTLWIASTGGLYSYDLSAGLAASPTLRPGGPTGLTALAVGSQSIWVGSAAGIARFDVGAETWQRWDTSAAGTLFGQLVSNDVQALAVTQPVIQGVTREIVWIGTRAGLSRFDPILPSFTTYAGTGNLPSDNVLDVITLPNQQLLVGTDKGLSAYRGQ